MTVLTNRQRRLRRRRRVRARIVGTAERPRLSVYRSNRGVFAQLVDDAKGHTVAAVNWTEPELRKLTASAPGSSAAAIGRGSRSTAPTAASSLSWSTTVPGTPWPPSTGLSRSCAS